MVERYTKVYLIGHPDLRRCRDDHTARERSLGEDGPRVGPVRVAGMGSWWLVMAAGDLYVDALFAVATSSRGVRCLEDFDVDERLLFEGDLALDEVLDVLSTVTSAVLALQAVASSMISRPRHSETDIAVCNEWLQHSYLQYLTGRGAQRHLLAPWLKFLEQHSSLVRRIHRSWETVVRPRADSLSASHPLYPLLHPLSNLSVERELTEILPEYRDRLSTMSQECGRISAEIGVLGGVASLSVVPVSDANTGLYLVPLALAGGAYFFGYRVASVVQGWSARRRARRSAAVSGSEVGDLAATIECALFGKVRILAGPELSSTDFASAVSIWLALLRFTRQRFPLQDVKLTAIDEMDVCVVVVIGGPLVRVPFADAAGRNRVPVVDLTDSGGAGWRFCRGSRVLASVRSNEHLGVLSAAQGRTDTLFVMGARDVGTLAAATTLIESFASGYRFPGEQDGDWVMVDAQRLLCHRGL